MAYTKSKRIAHVAPEHNPTPEEKQKAILRAIAQKRESYITAFAFGLAHNPGITEMEPHQVADYAVKVGDALMERLFPVTDKPAE